MAMPRHPPPGRPAFIQAAHPSTVPHSYNASSMKAIGIRCWPDSHQALPGCPSEGAERRGTSPRAPSHSQRPIASEARPTHEASPPPLVPRGNIHLPAQTAGFPLHLVTPKYCYVPLSGRGPAHCTRCQAAHARTVCLQRWTHYMYRPTPAAPRVCERLKRGLRPYPPRYRSSTPRSGPRCAAQVHGAARWSTRRRILR